MSWVSEIKEICGDYYIDIKYHENQKEAISLFFNSCRNAETVKRCIELDDIVPNVATAVDFVEVVRCKDCEYHHWEQEPEHGKTVHICSVIKAEVFKDFYCYHGKRKKPKML